MMSAMLGCRNLGSGINENDRLRAENLELHRAMDDLQQQVILRENELTAIQGQSDGNAHPIEGAQPPRLAGIRLDELTGVLDNDADGVGDELRVYLKPVDQDGRMMTVAGRVTLRLISIRDEGEPVTLIAKTFEPDQLHAAYRNGFTGTHYTLGGELPEDVPEQAVVHVAFTEAGTGRQYTTQQVIRLKR